MKSKREAEEYKDQLIEHINALLKFSVPASQYYDFNAKESMKLGHLAAALTLLNEFVELRNI